MSRYTYENLLIGLSLERSLTYRSLVRSLEPQWHLVELTAFSAKRNLIGWEVESRYYKLNKTTLIFVYSIYIFCSIIVKAFHVMVYKIRFFSNKGGLEFQSISLKISIRHVTKIALNSKFKKFENKFVLLNGIASIFIAIIGFWNFTECVSDGWMYLVEIYFIFNYICNSIHK